MTNTYLRTIRQAFRPHYHLLLLLMLVVPGLSHAQNFTETFGTAVPFESPANADANGRFDNSAAFSFGGNAVVAPNNAPSNGYSFTNATGASQAASGVPAIVFGRENPNNAGAVQVQAGVTYLFNIGNINTTGINSRQRISFGLRLTAAAAAADLVLEARDGNVAGSSFTVVPFTFPTPPANGADWFLVSTTASLPSTTNLILQFRKNSGNNVQYRIDDLTLRGFEPTLTASFSTPFFPNTPVNQQSIARTLTVTGSDLLGNATVTAPAGFLLRPAGTTAAYAQTATITPNANGNASAQFDVVFAPTLASAPGPYPQNITADFIVSSPSATSVAVTASGNATAPQPVLTANPNSLAFGAQTVGTSSASQSFQLTGRDLTGNVTVTAPNGFEIRVGGNAFSPNPITLVPTGGSINQPVDVRFVPGTTGTITGNVVATGNAGSQALVAVSGSGTAAPVTPTINSSTTNIDFQTVTNSGSAQTQTFTVSATNLSGPLTLTPSNANIEIRNATAGGSFTNAPLAINPNPSGNVTNQIIEVRLVPTVGTGNFNGNIALTSTNAQTVNVAVTATNPSGSISDISLTNPILTEFSTSPGVPSSVKSYNVSADNLLQDLTITAPQFFQIALSADPNAPGGFNSLGGTTGNSLVLPRITGSSDPTLNGDVDLTAIYVRYFPPGPQTNRGQVVSNSSAPARTQFVTVNGSSEPELDVIGSFATVVNLVKFEKSATQTLLLRGARLASPVLVRVPRDPEPGTNPSPLNPTRTPQFQISKFADFRDIKPDDEFPGTSLIFTPDENDSLAQVPLYVRYAPTRVGQATADLLFRTPDLFSNVEFTRVPNARLRGNAIDVEPVRQSAATVTRSADGRSVTIVFTQEDGSAFPGNPEAAGFGENRLIIASTSNTLTPGFFPSDATPYDPGNNVYGNGSNINGNFVVFASSATTAVITGLNPNVNYFFFGFEYNNDQVLGAENFKTPNLPITVQLPLPVELVSFTAQLRNGKVNLEWVTASEKNNRGFEVQRSQNGQQFSTVSYKEGRGTTTARTTYTDVDNQPLPGLSYYRLKQIDTDGKFVYSPAVIVKNAGLTEASFYPNPTSGKLTILLPQAANAAALRVQILDLTGRLVREETLPVTGELDLSALQAGTYMVTVGSGDQKVTRKVVKN
ncbi:T9SS type A sorting domain-containing protein [Microvirga sp. STR05]|uniref:T9SS type A sorting domain-containing protein n=1 Tax=Hymenobacter duratus TaxID=2771356 RepID=A0ABR8JL40_9BACT|nr:T9SS type A sorting domain-containing protein [Hymenobacter duratus]MBD2716341.1 T9SS type A sorting domain-containing protein [Hymenobacter duratus]MBR7951256.1 T9SS type A sorting domain-containing protein [Microvirga sp. STR05]